MFGVLALELLLLPSTSLSQAQEPVAANQRAERGVQLTIQVLGEDGNPVSIQVCLRGENAREICSTSDRLGTVTFFRLVPDSYIVLVFRASLQVWADQVEISNGAGVQSEIIRLRDLRETAPTVSVRDLMVPERSRKLYEVGKKALFRGDYTKAQKSLQSALSIYPNFPRARNALALVYAKQQDYAGATHQLEIAIKLDPRFGEAYFNYGIVLMNAGRYADAAAHFARAVDLDFSPDFVTDSLISSEIHANEPDAAIAALQTIHTKRLKHHASLHWQVAKFLDGLGRSQDAESQYRQYTAEAQ
jgi:tetratricopeptide (TPR) repeat protein